MGKGATTIYPVLLVKMIPETVLSPRGPRGIWERGRGNASYLLGRWRHIPGVGVPYELSSDSSSIFTDISRASFSDVLSCTHWSVNIKIKGMGFISIVLHGKTPPTPCISNPPPPPTCPTIVLWFGTSSYKNLPHLWQPPTAVRGRWEHWTLSEANAI